MNTNSALFVFDASNKTGGGHAIRCCAIAEELQTQNWNNTLLCSSESFDFMPHLNKVFGEIANCPNSFEAIKSTLEEKRKKYDLLIIDSYNISYEVEILIGSYADRILIVDDLADKKHACTNIININPVYKYSDYSSFIPEKRDVLIGPQYAILRKQFIKIREESISYRKNNSNKVDNILVVFGASDPNEILEPVLRSINESKFDGVVNVLSGLTQYKNINIEEIISSKNIKVILHSFIKNISEKMMEADLCIGSSGTLSWERSCMGLPSIIIQTAENQKSTAEYLDEYGAAINLGKFQNIMSGYSVLKDKINHLISDDVERNNMKNKCYSLVDGRGVRRIVMQLFPYLAKNKKIVSLRPAIQSDSDMIFTWQSNKRTRKYFNNPEIPEKSEHETWLKKKLSDYNCHLNIIEYDNFSVGVVKLDKISEEKYELSIYLDEPYYGFGIATAALNTLKYMYREYCLIANVSSKNERSKKLFISSGFIKKNNTYVYKQEEDSL